MSRDEKEKVVRENNKDYYPCGYDIESIKVIRNKLLDFQAALRGMNLEGKRVSDMFDFCYNQHHQKLGEVGSKYDYGNFPPPYFKDVQSLDEITEAVRNLDRLTTGNVKNLVFGSGAFFTRGYNNTNLYLQTEYSADRMQKVFGNLKGSTFEKADFTTSGINNFGFSAPNAMWLYGAGLSDENKNGMSFITTSMKFDSKEVLKDLSKININDDILSREEFLILMNSISPYVDRDMVRIIFGNPNQVYEISTGHKVPFKSTIRSNGSALNAESDSLIHLSTDKLDEMSSLKLENADYSCICNFSDYGRNLRSINVIVDESFMDEFMNSEYKGRLTDFFAVNLEYSKAKRKGVDSSEFNQTMVAPTDDRVKRRILVPEIKK
jgi:hypothetical protein